MIWKIRDREIDLSRRALVMGIMTASSTRPILMSVWAIVPALSITVVIALAFPFAHRIGVNLAPLQAVAENLAAR